jgi:UPF0716 family protein affecting phage T7 exclusion
MKSKKMPMTNLLNILSWIIAGFGLLTGGFYCTISFKAGIAVIFGAVILAAIIRGLGNIGQILFDFHSNALRMNQEIKQAFQNNSEVLQGNLKVLKDNSEVLQGNFKVLQDNFEITRKVQSDNLGINQELKKVLKEEFGQTLHDNLKPLQDWTRILREEVQSLTQALNNDSDNFNHIIQQINCDSRDINKTLYEMNVILEKIKQIFAAKK